MKNWAHLGPGAPSQVVQDELSDILSDRVEPLLARGDFPGAVAAAADGLAEAQFGEAEVAPYRDAVARASDDLKSAFTLRQQLDDAVPETPDDRRRLVEQTLEHATRAKAALDEQQRRIEQLRDLERRAPEILAGLPAQLDAVAAPQACPLLTSELHRFEQRVRREEAMARGMEEVAASSIEEQFSQLDADEDELEVEARFSRLKAGQAPLLTSGG